MDYIYILALLITNIKLKRKVCEIIEYNAEKEQNQKAN